MKLPRYVKISFVPIFGRNIANSIGPFIFLPKHVYKDLESDNSKPYNIALLIHKETHRRRQKEIGLVKFGLKYLLDPKFRFNEELMAVKEAMRYLKKNKVPFDFDREAKLLPSYLYLWPVSRHYAKEELRKVWDEA